MSGAMRDRDYPLFPGTVDPDTGAVQPHLGSCVTWEQVPVLAGDVIHFYGDSAPARVFFYRDRLEGESPSTDRYRQEGFWTIYDKSLSCLTWGTEDYTVQGEGYVRVEFASGRYAHDCLEDHAELVTSESRQRTYPKWVDDEVARVAERVEGLQEPGDCVLLLVADLHRFAGDGWSTFAACLDKTAKALQPSHILQLGDVVDGRGPYICDAGLYQRTLGFLSSLGAPLHSCVGNHDLFACDSAGGCVAVDVGNGFHMLFLDSYHPGDKEPFGFDKECLRWLKQMLAQVPEGHKVAVFSHVPPLAKLHKWSGVIQNGDKVIRELESFNAKGDGNVLAFVHGHAHRDGVCAEASFPIVSVGCGSFEYSRSEAIAGISPLREFGTPSQVLFDVVIAKPTKGSLQFVRFGAGDDRSIDS